MYISGIRDTLRDDYRGGETRARRTTVRGTTTRRDESRRKQTPIFRLRGNQGRTTDSARPAVRYKERAHQRYRTLATACALDSGFLVTSVH